MISLCHTFNNPIQIVYPKAITTYAFDMADTLATFIQNICGIRPVLVCDCRPEPDVSYISLGETALMNSDHAYEHMGYGKCVIAIPENSTSIVVATHTEALLTDAVRYLTENMKWQDNRIVFINDLASQCFYSMGMLKYLPYMKYGTQVHCRRSFDSCDQIVIADVIYSEWCDYCTTLVSDGFVQNYKNTIGNNFFARFEKDACSVYVYYTEYNKTMRILTEPVINNHKEGLFKEKKSVAPLMTMLGGRFSDVSRYMNCDSGCGNMGYVFRMEDGRFILVDGGMDIGNYAENMMRILREQADDPSHIVIACWFLSHTHIDHTGAFLTVAQQYSDQLEIEEIVCNFPSIRDAETFREAWNTRRVKESIARYYPHAKYSKVHTGEVLRFGNVKVEILYTQDDLVRQYLSLSNETLNTASICLRIFIAGNTIMLPADCDTTANRIVLGMYGDYLKSDVLQVCHHGGWGGTTELYAAIDPELVLFSTSDTLYPKYLQIKYNHDLVYDMHVKESYNNAERCRTFELPYHPTAVNLPPDPKEEILYTEAKQLEALASIDNLRNDNSK